jgi:predicted acyltransferase
MPVARPRLGALDLLRGVTVAGMIVVNNPGNWSSVFPQLTHAPWHGVTAADLIFPAFIFIMGVAMSLALPSTAPAGTRAQLYRRIARRAALLVLLGLVLNAAAAWPHLESMRIPGVLQRIGLTYLAAAVITVDTTGTEQWTIAAGLLMVHCALLVIPLGGPASGHLEPGRNIAAAIDRSLFGSHMLSPAGDPEGALGLLSSIATALLGSTAGRWLLRSPSAPGARPQLTREVVWKFAAAGICAIALAWVWAAILPLNKSLWTPSFALLTSGVATLCLVGATLLDQSLMRPALAPFFWLGTNPLAIYFLSELTTDLVQVPWLTIGGHYTAPKDWFFWWVLAPRVGDSGGPWSSLIYALLYTGAWIGVAGMMRWRGVRFRV